MKETQNKKKNVHTTDNIPAPELIIILTRIYKTAAKKNKTSFIEKQKLFKHSSFKI